MEAIVLILSDAHGQYIPRNFVTDAWNEISIEHCEAWQIKPEDAAILQNPEHEWYWETWHDVLNYAKYTDTDGSVYRLHQDGDLWGICYEKVTDEEKINFGFDEGN